MEEKKYDVDVIIGDGTLEKFNVKGILYIDEYKYYFTNKENEIIACFPIKRTIITEDKFLS